MWTEMSAFLHRTFPGSQLAHSGQTAFPELPRLEECLGDLSLNEIRALY